MYRQDIYYRKLQDQLKAIMLSSDRGYLTLSPQNNPYYYSSNVLLGFSKRLIPDLIQKSPKTAQDYIYLIVAQKIIGESHFIALSEFKEKYPEVDASEKINRLVEYFSKFQVPEPTHSKEALRRKFQMYLGKAEVEGYFKIPEVPAFLITTHWLQKFFGADESNPGPINNQLLLEPMDFPIASDKYSHLNYRVRPEVRENEEFKVLPYEAWKLLYDNFGGIEVRRFTTKEKRPTVEIWYMRTNIWIVEERAVLIKLDLLISKNETIQEVLERVRVTLKKYEGIPESYLARQPGVYKVNGLEPDQFIALLHSEEQSHLLTHKMEKIKNIGIEFEECIFSDREALVINYARGHSQVFQKVPPLKVFQLKEKCLSCGNMDDLEQCKCKTVYFCSKECRQRHKDHLKECSSIQGEVKKYNLVTDYFDVKKKSYPNLGPLIPLGKVGLENLGNTCYMNSALQCVLRIEPLVRFFLNNQHLKDLNVTNVLGSEGYLACAFGEFVKTFYTTGCRALQPSAVLRVIAKNPQFRGYNHQDSQQFLNYFLDKLHQDLNRVKSKPYLQQVQSKGRPDEIVSKESWDNYLKRNNSLISDLLAGQYRSEIRCPDCHKLSITFDPFLSLTLQFPKPDKGTDLKGWLMTDEGQFQSFSIQVRSSMPTHEFYDNFFRLPVFGVYQRDKVVTDVWDPKLTVFENKKERGILFFYQKPLGHAVQIRFLISSPGAKDPQNFVRIVFVKSVDHQEQLLEMAFLAIRKPLQKALEKDFNTQDYISYCKDLDFFKISSVVCDPQADPAYPIGGAVLVRVGVEFDQSKLKLKSQLKLNAGGAKYDGKTESLVRKVGNQLTMPELLQCFSEPQKLTEENSVYCSFCKDHKLADKTMELYKTPRFLIVHLKRFNHRGDSGNRYIIYGQKVNTPILLNEFQKIKGKRYQLVGVVNHVGSLVHGHYTAMVKRGEWFNYDDSRCSRTSLDGRNAYLLFYQFSE